MKVVGHMMIRNEADVIAEVINEDLRWVRDLIVLDGGSDDGTIDIVRGLAKSWAREGRRIHLVVEPDEGGQFHDHTRNRLLELTADFHPDWVISFDGDEIYHHPIMIETDQGVVENNPITAIEFAEEAGCNIVQNLVPQFWLTFQDLRENAIHEDPTLSVQLRRRWYSWGWVGRFIWKWNPQHFYPTGVQKRTPEVPGRTWREWQRVGPMRPICKHYCIRSVEQGLKRTRERLARGGRRYFGKYALRWIVDEQQAGLHYLGQDEIWNSECNHDRVTRWMGSGTEDSS